ncbi:MAG: hypothetical protein EOM24_16265, partial [Chloroflexia bacterium]|nr:hypothetical protein [Chloroflexia bacterium]
MTKQMQTILASIEAWHEKYQDAGQGITPDMGIGSCPCCDEYRFSASGMPCEGCPIKEHTGEPLCQGSPYSAALDEANRRVIRSQETRREELLRSITAEIGFLVDVAFD